MTGWLLIGIGLIAAAVSLYFLITMKKCDAARIADCYDLLAPMNRDAGRR